MPKKKKSGLTYDFVHTPRSSKGLGDYYGTGIPAKIGKLRSDTVGMVNLSPSKLKKPPKSLA